MSFASPWLLLFLLAVPLAILGYALLDRRRARRAQSWSSPLLLPNMVPASPGLRRYIPLALCLVGLVLLLAGFARPQATIDIPREGATVVLAIDISGSMAAKDVKPTRLGAANAAALQFVKDMPGKYRLSLITFSMTATVRVIPTFDHDSVGLALPTKTQRAGTDLAAAVTKAITVAERAVGPNAPGSVAVLLLSDGSQTVGEIDPAVPSAKARRRGIAISTVSLGTPKGVVVTKIPGGEEVNQVPPAPAALKSIAQITGGKFFAARTPEQLQQVYKDLDESLIRDKKKREITVATTGAALVFLLAGAVLSGLWFRRLV